MKSLNLIPNQKRGNVDSKIAMLIGMVIVIVMVVAVAPTMFSGLTNITGAPSFFTTVFPIIVAAGLIFLVWRSVSHE
jgi:hypothetical protein